MKIKEIKIVNQDGSTELANIGADAINVDYNNTTVKNELDKLNATDNSLINTQANQGNTLTSLQSQVSSLASGSPAGVYATVAALTTADPDHTKTYIVTKNGHWYYYNDGWQDGGVYQSSFVNENDFNLQMMNDSIKREKITFTSHNGAYITSHGTILSQNGWSYSDPIYCKNGTKIDLYAKGYQISVGMIALSDENGNIIKTVVSSVDSTLRLYSYVMEADGYIMISYQTSETAALYFNSNTIEKTEKLFEYTNIIQNPNITWTYGYYANGGGLIAHANYKYSNTFVIPANSTVYIYAQGEATPNVNILSYILPGTQDTFRQLVGSNSASKKWYSIDVVEDTTAFACTRAGQHDCQIYIVPKNTIQENTSNINVLNNNIDIIQNCCGINPISDYDVVHRYYIRWGDGVAEANNSFDYSEPIAVTKDEYILFNAKGYDRNVAMISTCNSDGTNVVPKVRSIDSTTRNYVYKVEADGYVCLCWDNRTSTICSRGSNISNFGLDDRLTIIEENTPISDNPLNFNMYGGGYMACFHKIGVIGDSLASGNTNHSSGEMSDATYSWIQCIARICGVQGFNFSAGGMTTRSWLSRFVDNSTFTGNLCTAYFIGLGVNDRYYHSIGSESGVELGTPDDIDFEDRTQCADTFYGNYANIIMYIKEVQPKAKIFIITNPRTVGETSDYNDAIRYMAEHFDNVYLIDLFEYANDEYEHKYASRPYWNGAHGTALGYREFGLQILSYTNWLIKNNINDFADIQFIGTDYHF